MRNAVQGMTPAELRVLADIDENGVHIVHVPESDDGPEYSYTVGMPYSFEAPELIVFGLPAEIARDLLDAIVDEAADGTAFVAEAQREGLLHGYPVRFFDVPGELAAKYLGVAQWAHEGAAFACLQVVWPDKQGRWPWMDDVREGFAEMQPVIGRRS